MKLEAKDPLGVVTCCASSSRGDKMDIAIAEMKSIRAALEEHIANVRKLLESDDSDQS